MTIGQRIRDLRIEQNMSQDELATLVGYKTRSAINKIELNERDVKHSQILLFAKALKTTPNYLMGWTDDKSSQFHSIQQHLCDLNPNEYKMLEVFRKLSPVEQGEIIGRAELLVEQREASVSKDA
jgi:transcriptional regulator with XRE-family HTH domain